MFEIFNKSFFLADRVYQLERGLIRLKTLFFEAGDVGSAGLNLLLEISFFGVQRLVFSAYIVLGINCLLLEGNALVGLG